jgi:peptide/nickel transport system substrate-binding protein
MSGSAHRSEVLQVSTELMSSVVNRREVLKRAIVIGAAAPAIATLLAACGDDDDPAAPPADEPGTDDDEPTEEPDDEDEDEDADDAPMASGGHMRIAQAGEPDTLDMHRTESSSSWEVGWALYDIPIIAGEDLTLYPLLAQSWEANDDGTEFTLEFRDDVVFHDGTPFNAEAFKWNLDRVVDPATGSLYAAPDLGPYEATEVVDEYTARVTMTRPNGFFIRAMSLMEFGVLAPSVGDMVIEDVGRDPVASGPFQFSEWVTQDRITLERYDDYTWGASPPYDHTGPAHLDAISFHVIADAPTRVAALESGEMDIITRTPGTDVARLEAAGFRVVKGLQTGMPTGFIVNTNKFPTNDPAVRKAINLGLNRQQISDGLYAGQEAPGYCPITPTTFAHWDCTNDIYFDPDEAQSVLEEAGWEKSGDFYEKDGERLVLDVYVFGTGGPIGEAFQAAIRPVGIDVNLQVVPFTEQKIVGFEGRHNLMVGRFDAPDPKIIGLLYHSDNIGETGFTWTHLAESNPELQAQVDELLDAGLAEPDTDARIAIYEELQQILVRENMFVAMKYDAMIVAMKESVQGVKFNDMGFQVRVYDLHFDE